MALDICRIEFGSRAVFYIVHVVHVFCSFGNRRLLGEIRMRVHCFVCALIPCYLLSVTCDKPTVWSFVQSVLCLSRVICYLMFLSLCNVYRPIKNQGRSQRVLVLGS